MRRFFCRVGGDRGAVTFFSAVGKKWHAGGFFLGRREKGCGGNFFSVPPIT